MSTMYNNMVNFRHIVEV